MGQWDFFTGGGGVKTPSSTGTMPQRQESYRNPDDGSGYDIIRGYTADDGPSGGAFSVRVNLRGPRLLNLNIAFSLYGIPIPISFGVRRLSGNLLWANSLSERRDKDKKYITPGLGGGGGFQSGFALNGLSGGGLNGGTGAGTIKLVTYTYYYFADFAVGFGYGDPTITSKVVARIWANGKLIYDMGNGNAADPSFRLAPARYFPDLRFRFYPGTEDQQPDPFIMSVENPKYAAANDLEDEVNVVPAYRGQMYIVFEKFPLGPFQNQIPDIQVELTDAVDVADFDDDYDGILEDVPVQDASGLGVDWTAQVLFSVINGTLHYVDITTNSVRFAFPLASPDIESYRVYAYSPLTSKMYESLVEGDTAVIHYFDPFMPTGISTGTVTGQLGLGPYILPNNRISKLVPVPYFDEAGFIQDAVFAVETTGGSNIYIAPSTLPVYQSGDVTYGLVPGPVTELIPTCFLIEHAGTGILKFGPDTLGKFTLFDSGEGAIMGAIWVNRYSYLLIVENPTVDTGQVRAVTMDQRTLWTSELFTDQFLPLATEDSYFIASDTQGPTISIPGAGRIIELDMATGATVRNKIIAGVEGSQFTVTSANNQAVYGLQHPNYYDKPFFSRTNLKLFIEFASRLAGMDSADIDVSDSLAAIVIDGAYIIEVSLSFRDLLKNLQQAFLFDVRESDGVLEVFKREDGEEPDDFAFTSTDLLITNANWNSALDINRTSDDQIPNMIYFRYLDFILDYEENVAIAQRSNFPDATNNSKTHLEISIPVIMRLAEAKAWAVKVLYSMWSARNAYAFMLKPEAYKFEPGDAGSITVEGNAYTIKLSRVIYNADYSLSVNAVSFRNDFPFETSVDDPMRERQTLLNSSPSYPFVLDIPNPFPSSQDLTNSNGGKNALIKGYAGPATIGNWLGGNIVINVDNKSFDLGPIDPNYLPKIGFLQADFDSPDPSVQWSTDDTNELTVKFADSDFDPSGSLSYTDWVNGSANVIVIGNEAPFQEIVVARHCVDNGDGTFTFSTFMRGYRGTDQDLANGTVNKHRWFHEANTRFVFLPPDSTKDTYLEHRGTIPFAFGESFFGFNFVRIIATNYGGLEMMPARNTITPFYGMQARPFSPVHLRAYDDGADNLVITFVRRSRAPDPWPDDGDVDGPDVWESVEEFGCRFFSNDSYGGVNEDAENTLSTLMDDKTRGVVGGDNYTFTLDSALRNTYLNSSVMPATVYLKVLQRSVDWGDGVPRYATLAVEPAP
jgi:hypothetical protein